MNLFGLQITKAKPAAQPTENRLLANLVWRWLQGREWAKTSDETSLLNAFRSWVYICASKNASTVASVPFKLYGAKQGGSKGFKIPARKVMKAEQDRLFRRLSGHAMVRKAIEFEEILEHPMIDLLEHVNLHMNQKDLIEITDIYQELTGNAYWYIPVDAQGVPAEIWPIQPDRMSIIPDPVEFISHYIFRNGAERIRFETSEIIQFKFPNPKDPYYGMSPLMAVADAYNINTNMAIYENAMFSNNARTEGFFTTDQELDPVTHDRLTSELTETLAGIRNAGKTGLLSHGLDYKAMNLPPRELGFLNGRKWTKEEIYNAFDVPTGLLDQNANRANAEAAQYTYMKFGIEPRVMRFEEKVNERLSPMYDERLFIVYEGVVPEDRDFALREDVALFGIGARSQNEIREARGSDTFEGGNILYTPFSLSQIGTTDGSELPEKPEPVAPVAPVTPAPGANVPPEQIEEMANIIAAKAVMQLTGSA